MPAPAVFADSGAHLAALKQLTPRPGHLLHGVFPGGKTGAEDDITTADVMAYEKAAGQRVSWVYFSHNWYQSRRFPTKTAQWIRARKATPYVRLMLRSDTELGKREPKFTLKAINAGKFDRDFSIWGQAVAAFKTPVIAEFGTEVNGKWFPWNGHWNGRSRGPVQFVSAYRRIIDLTRAAGADNIIWVFHANNGDWPQTNWNKLENYYPGDDYIDWLAVSIYSTQNPKSRETHDFASSLTTMMRRFKRMAPAKPVIVAEFGTDVHNPHESASQWADKAFQSMLSGHHPGLIGFSWWNESWQNDSFIRNDTDMRIQSDPALAATFLRHLANPKIQHP